MTDPPLTALLQDPDEAVRCRALLVRDALSLGPTRAAEGHGVTRQTATKWVARYRSGGAAGLLGEPHRRRTSEQIRLAILTAPLWMPTTKWSSRAIAAAVGVSQSHVARAWMQASVQTAVTDRLANTALNRDPTLVGLLVAPECSILAVKLGPARHGPVPLASAPASPRTQRALRTVLAADLTRSRIDGDGSAEVVQSFWDDVTASCGDPSTLAVVTSAPVPVPVAGIAHMTCGNAAEWQALLVCVAHWRDETLARTATALEAELREWHREGHRTFSWVASEASADEQDGWIWRPRSQSGARRVSPERALADEIIATIRQGVATGQLAGGDRVTERFLAGRLRTTRGQIRAALRILDRDGLVTITHGHAAVVPVPTRVDVVETYAARRALGSLMVRAATRWTAEARRPVAEAMTEIERLAANDDNALCNQADMTFQHALAEASGLTRIGPMLQLLGQQVRMFIAVVGINYAFPIEPIVERNRAVLAAIDEGNEELAAQRWREKIDEALAYMLEQVEAAHEVRRVTAGRIPAEPASPSARRAQRRS
ncbi:MAG TPA: FCD domain-containing protein [Actinophytocola sp.]|nr:FCD domain-containing protein [Actinophytocola sp.]